MKEFLGEGFDSEGCSDFRSVQIDSAERIGSKQGRRKKHIKNEGFRLLIAPGNHRIERAFSGFGLGELSGVIEKAISGPKIMEFGKESFTDSDSYNLVGALGKNPV
ncbi:hypothetical protein U1Q18_006985 [Sarracenia purpurea var. burkii]